MSWQFLDIVEEGVLIDPSFKCGNKSIDRYLTKYAVKNHRNDISRAVVLVPVLGPKYVVGFYTLSSYHIRWDTLLPEDQEEIPKYGCPATLIGQFAVHLDKQGEGLGRKLLMHAFYECVKGSKVIGSKAVVVEVHPEDPRKDKNLAAYQDKWKFRPLKDKPLTLILKMDKVRKLFEP